MPPGYDLDAEWILPSQAFSLFTRFELETQDGRYLLLDSDNVSGSRQMLEEEAEGRDLVEGELRLNRRTTPIQLEEHYGIDAEDAVRHLQSLSVEESFCYKSRDRDYESRPVWELYGPGSADAEVQPRHELETQDGRQLQLDRRAGTAEARSHRELRQLLREETDGIDLVEGVLRLEGRTHPDRIENQYGLDADEAADYLEALEDDGLCYTTTERVYSSPSISTGW